MKQLTTFRPRDKDEINGKGKTNKETKGQRQSWIDYVVVIGGAEVSQTEPDCPADTGVILETSFHCTIHSPALNMGDLDADLEVWPS